MNEMKRKVHIQVTTVNDGRKERVESDGEVYVKGGQVYIRYQENGAGLEGVTTTVKIGAAEIAVLRHGPIRSEQRFAVGRRAVGYYETAQGTFRLETLTERVDMQLEDGIGTAAWSYRLWVSDAEAGHFQVNLDVREGMKA